jgi:hypothetical protein
MTLVDSRAKCDVSSGVFTHSRDTETTPCEGDFKSYLVDLGGRDISMVVCDKHLDNRVFNAHVRRVAPDGPPDQHKGLGK